MENKKKTRFYDWSIEEINKIKQQEKKPIIGIHACCAPCSLHPLEFLGDYFKIKLLFNNSNIYPESEYQKRLNELIKIVSEFNVDRQEPLDLIIFPYKNNEYEEEFSPLSEEKEGGNRCFKCYEKRMRQAYEFSNNLGYDYFTTVMTISRQKNSEILNEIGKKLEKEFNHTKYFYSDFKKKGGDYRRQELLEQYQLYNQLYCGCKSSYEAYKKKESK